MLALPAIASFNPMVLVESNRLNLLRLWLCAETRVLRFDLLHLLRIGLLPLGPRFSLRNFGSRLQSRAASHLVLASAPEPAAPSLSASAFLPHDRKHPFPSREHFQIPRARDSSGLFQHRAQSSLHRSIYRGRSFLERLQVRGPREFFGSFPREADSWHAHV